MADKLPPWRPREHEREQIAKDMIEWAKKDDSLNLCGFCAENSLAPSVVTRWAREEQYFCLAYEIAKSYLGKRREEGLKAGTVHQKAYDLNAKTYDKFLHDQWELEKEFEAHLKIKELKEEIRTLEQLKKDLQSGDLTQK